MIRDTIFTVTERTLRRTTSPHLQIKFNLFFHYEYLNYPIRRDSRTGPRPTPLPSLHHNTTAHVIAPGNRAYGAAVQGAVQDAVGTAIGNRLRGPERARAIALTCREVLKTLSPAKTLPDRAEFNVDMEIRIRYLYDYRRERRGSGMVPAAASSLQLLEKCDEEEEEEGERCCCICLEETGSGEDRRLPCSHVFHGGCIEE